MLRSCLQLSQCRSAVQKLRAYSNNVSTMILRCPEIKLIVAGLYVSAQTNCAIPRRHKDLFVSWSQGCRHLCFQSWSSSSDTRLDNNVEDTICLFLPQCLHDGNAPGSAAHSERLTRKAEVSWRRLILPRSAWTSISGQQAAAPQEQRQASACSGARSQS
jgi:hypothetical protein